jgi:hypothetical protein
VLEGEKLKWADVDYDANDPAVKIRREMEAAFCARSAKVEPGFADAIKPAQIA